MSVVAADLLYRVGADGQVIRFESAVLDHLESHRQVNPGDREAGGQLFGQFTDGDVRVLRATGPGPNDWRSRFGFRPNRKAERKEIRQLHSQDMHYLGDWHTHPEQFPRPSLVDEDSIVDTFRKSKHDLRGFLMVIVGTADIPEGLFVAVCDDQGCTRLELSRAS